MEAAASNNFEAEIERIQNEANTIRTKAQELTRLCKECTVATNEQLSSEYFYFPITLTTFQQRNKNKPMPLLMKQPSLLWVQRTN